MVEYDEGVTIGYDSRTSVGQSYFEKEGEKVFVNNGMIFGVAGAVLDGQIIRYADLPNPEDGGWDTDKWVTNELIPAMFDALSDRSASEFYSGKVESNSHTLAVVRGRVYQIYTGGSWNRRTDQRYAIGSGSPYVIGALAARVSVREALEIAAQHDKGTGNRLRVIDSAELLGE